MLKKIVEINKFPNRDTSGEKHEEYQYINLLNDILTDGTLERGRNGNVKVVIGSSMHFSLENNVIPILTTKKQLGKHVSRDYCGL